MNDIVIVTSHFSENLDWLVNYKKLFKDIIVCDKKGSKEMSEKVLKNLNCTSCPTVENKGREATAYLSYIINNYNNLSQYTAFIHGHETAWHQQSPYHLIDTILKAKINEYNYISLNILHHPGEDRNWVYDIETNEHHIFKIFKKYWQENFYSYLGEIPKKFSHDCCGQFIVNKNLILKHPKEAYQKWYDFFFKIDEYEENGNYDYSIIFEYIWHIIFGEAPVCQFANKEYFKQRYNGYIPEEYKLSSGLNIIL